MDNRRRTIVINKKFQYQYALLIVALAVLALNSFLVLRLWRDDGLTLSVPAAFGLAIGELLLIGIIWWRCLRFSLRIAGPVYVFNREIGRLGAGDLTARIALRDDDLFQEEAAQMNASIIALRAKVAAARQLADQLRQAHLKGDDTAQLIGQLHAALVALRTGEDG